MNLITNLKGRQCQSSQLIVHIEMWSVSCVLYQSPAICHIVSHKHRGHRRTGRR